MADQERPPPTADDATGRYAWPAGRRLARDLPLLLDCRGKRVCDLGCGGGVVGCAALAHGASEVVFLDVSDGALADARTNVAGDPRARFLRHVWGEAPPGSPFAIILGGDILYREAYFAALMHSIALGLAEDGVCLLSDPRRTLEPELSPLARAQGLSYQLRRLVDVTIIELRLLRP